MFGNLDAFQEWFNLPMLQASLPTARSSQIIGALHAILKPFLLRRLKADVMSELPPKKEYVLYAPLTEQQRSLYDAVVGGGLRALLVRNQHKDGEGKEKAVVDVDAPRASRSKVQVGGKGKGKGKKRQRYEELEDEEYFEKLENGDDIEGLSDPRKREKEKDAEELGREWALKAARMCFVIVTISRHLTGTTVKSVNNMKLQNTVMQLRYEASLVALFLYSCSVSRASSKVCSHPFLFHWPVDAASHQPIMNSELVDASGKMMVLERLLDELFARKHKVLLFSQFTTMLDIIEVSW